MVTIARARAFISRMRMKNDGGDMMENCLAENETSQIQYDELCRECDGFEVHGREDE